MEELCGKKATYRVEMSEDLGYSLCTRHFSNKDVQYLITRKWVRYQRLEDGGEECQAEVVRRAKEESVDG